MTTPPEADPALDGGLAFLRQAERLKSTLRSAHTATGRQESTAEHTWRLCLMAVVFGPRMGPDIDLLKVLKIALVHDLGEAISGDIPATQQHAVPDKSERERRDLLQLCADLPDAQRDEILALWEDYEHAASPEARLVKGLDKLETILQHHQGANPPGFDHAFNLQYGAKQTAGHPLLEAIRVRLDEGTRRLAGVGRG